MAAFQSDSGMILVDLSSPFGMTTELFDGNEVEVFQWTGVEIGVHGFFHVLVTPLAIHIPQQITDDPSLRRLDLLAVFQERPFPDGPQDTAEDPASITVSEARQLDARAIILGPLAALCVLGDEVFS